MRVFRNELFKVISKPMFLFLLVILIAANMLLITTLSPSNFYSAEQYKQAYLDMEDMSGEERLVFVEERYNTLRALNYMDESDGIGELMTMLNLSQTEAEECFEKHLNGEFVVYTDDIYAEFSLFNDLYKEVEAISNYSNYLDGIMQKADNSHGISIFNTQDEFSQRNSKKTAAAFAPLIGNELSHTNSKMLNTAMEFSATDIILVLMLFLVVTILFTYEKEKRLFILLKPNKNGTAVLMAAKIGALLVLSMGITLVLYTSSFIAAGMKYGMADLSVKVQSIYGFDGCSFDITVWQYMIVYFVSKMAVAFLISLILLFFTVTTKSSTMVYVKTIGFFAIFLALYLLISGTSSLQILKYINIIFFLRVTPIYQYYFNLNILRYPVNIFTAFIVVMVLATVIFIALNIYLFAKRDTVVSNGARKQKNKKHKNVHTSLVYHEMYKIFVSNKVAVILVFLVAFQIYMVSQQSTYVQLDEFFYKQYMTALEGPVTDESLRIVDDERKRFEELDVMLADATERFSSGTISEIEYQQIQMYYSEQTRGRPAFEMVLANLEYVQKYNETADGKEAWLVYETGWNVLTGKTYNGYDDDMTQTVVLMLVIIASFAAIFSTEFSTRMIYIITSYKNGRSKTVRIKMLICIGVMTLIFVMNYIVQMIGVYRQYGLSGFDAYICSIQSLAAFPVNMKIWQYILILYLVRYVTSIAVLCVVFMVSIYAKNTTQTISILSVVLLIPPALHLLDTDVAKYFSLNAFLSGNMYLDTMQRSPIYVLLIFIPIGIGVFSISRVRKVFVE